MADENTDTSGDSLAFLSGGGELGRRIRAFDWSATTLGPIASWPQSLRSALSICLNSNFPIAIYWGSDLVLLYNDQWSPIPGEKHPWALGRPAREAWPEIWHIIEPLFQRVMTTGEATRSRDQLLPMHRHGFTEECYFDYTFSPIRGQNGQVEGVFNAVLETTTRVIGERRLRTLRELGAWKTGESRSAEEACQTAAHILAENPHDLPFLLLYLLGADGQIATLAGATGLGQSERASPIAVDLGDAKPAWPFPPVAQTGKAVEVRDLVGAFGSLPGGAWPESPNRAVVLPIAKSGQAQVAGFIVAGISPRLALNDDYRGFLDLLAGHVAAAVASARAHEEERRRAEALAELDRAKTAFFSNVSHEFRTPLTLMLGPVEDMLANSHAQMPRADDRPLLEVVQRNGRRLQRLVNSLLDFSRIEAGRMRATYEPTNLAAFTADLASNFRSACDRAGLKLRVDCPPLSEPVFVDRQMVEKVVLNLLSNAFKFTLNGEIAVTLRQVGRVAELQVRDTGIGIPVEEMPRLFERFHRIENARGRTHEGSGIGLALVHELVKLHGGSIRAESQLGNGTTFIVTIPLGRDHLPSERLASGPTQTLTTAAGSFVEEALGWLPDSDSSHQPGRELGAAVDDQPALGSASSSGVERPRVLVADDNADMRRYVERLLSSHYIVESVADGVTALESVRRRAPDLILSDVMMPRLDGFGLLRELRRDSETVGIPIILLSARAGEESRVEGMQAGADDYIVKPFSSRELLARVGALLQINRLRRDSELALRQSEERFRVLFETMTEGFAIEQIIFNEEGSGCDLRYLEVNPAFERHTGLNRSDIVGRTASELFPDAEPEWFEHYEGVVKTGVPSHFRAKFGPLNRWFEFSAYRTGANQIATVFFDITEQVRAGEALKASEQRFRQLADAMPQIVWTARPDGETDYQNRRWVEFTGLPDDIGNKGWSQILHPEDAATARERWAASLRNRVPFEMEVRLLDRRDASYRWHLIRTVAVTDEAGSVAHWYGTSTDIHHQKRAEETSRYLADASAALAGVVDYESTLQKVANLAVPYFADWSAVDVADGDGKLRRLAVAHQDRAKIDLVHKLMRDYPPDPQAPMGTYAVLRTGKPEFISEITDEMLVGGAKDQRHLELIRSLRLKSYISVPLAVAGKTYGVLTYATAESGRRYTQNDLALATDLAQRAAVAIENTRLYQALRDADHRKDEFLATLAHELRNPLAPLRNGLQVLRLSGLRGEMADEARMMMERQLGQMVHLIDDLLDLSRISRGKIELRKERAELAKVVQQAVETSRPAIEQAGHDFVIDLPPGPIYVDADVTRLAQVFSNLLNNAAKYTERGGRIRLTVQRQNTEVVLSVRDTGIGIPAHMLPHVFDMFTQVDRNLERSQSGLGIGLSIVKRLVEMHGGSVVAKSDGHGMGSEFVVRLPIVLSVMQTSNGDDEVAVQPSNRRRVLVVDDNRDAAVSLAMMLKLMGNDTKTAHDGLEALDVAGAYRPDLILLDIGMPRMNGYDTAREIRKQQWGKRIVLVALTGWGQEEDRRKSELAGFDVHLVKPIEPTALEKLLATVKSDTG